MSARNAARIQQTGHPGRGSHRDAPDRGERRDREDTHADGPLPPAGPGGRPVGGPDPGGHLHGGRQGGASRSDPGAAGRRPGRLSSGARPADPEDEVLAGLLGRLPDRAAAARRLANAVQGFDEAAILTIHGFCQRALKESAFESGQPFETELVPDEGELLQEVVDDFWRRTLYSGSAFLVGHLLKTKTRTSPERWAKTIRPYLGKPYLSVRPPAPPSVGAEAEAQYAARYREARALWENGPRGDRGDPAHPDGAQRPEVSREIPAGLARRDRGALRPAEAYAGWCDRVEKFAARSLTAAAKKGTVAPTHPFFAACERLADARASLEAYLDFQTKTLRLTLRDILRPRAGLAKAAPTTHGVQRPSGPAGRGPGGGPRGGPGRGDPPALQRGVDRRVPGHRSRPVLDLQADLRRDRSPAVSGGGSQAGHLRLPRGGHLRLSEPTPVGSGERRTLDRELALRPRLIQAVNAVFGRARDPFLFPEIPFYPVSRPRRTGRRCPWRERTGRRFGSGASPRGREQADGQGRGDGRRDPGDRGRDRQAPRPGRSGRGSDRRGALAGGDIAVLVRTNAQAGKMREALLGLGVASVQLSEARVFASREAAEVERVLLAVAQPNREALLRVHWRPTCSG